MIHGYHVILPCYGCWLPNDPRGSWSDFVGCWEIAKYGKTTRTLDQRKMSHLTESEMAQRDVAKSGLKFAPVILNGQQALSVAKGFAKQAKTSGYAIWACSILPEHTHMVIARHRYKIEQVANLLKGAATRQLVEDDRHPFAEQTQPGESPSHMWARHQWKVFLDTEDAIENAIAYVIENPIKEGKPRQNWKWLTPFRGIEHGWITYQ